MISIKKPVALTFRELKVLSKLRLEYGELYPNLLLKQNMQNPLTRICMVKKHGRIVAWGLIHLYRSICWGGDFFGSRAKEKHPMIQLYVAPEYRRKGIGSKIISKLKRYSKDKVYIFSHDENSMNLYRKVKDGKVMCHPNYEGITNV